MRIATYSAGVSVVDLRDGWSHQECAKGASVRSERGADASAAAARDMNKDTSNRRSVAVYLVAAAGYGAVPAKE